MKITFYVPSLIGGGAERVVSNLASYLADIYKYDITIVIIAGKENTYPISPKVRIRQLWKMDEKNIRIIRIIKKLYRLIKVFRTEKSDVSVSFLHPFNMLCLLLKPIMNGKLICTERNYPGVYPRSRMILLNLFSFLADAWVYQTKENAKFYTNRYIKKIFIPNAVDLKLPMINCNKMKKIVSVGRLHPQKNFQCLLKAFANVVKMFPDYHLYIYGQGKEYQKLLNLASKFKIVDNVHFVGFIDNIHQEIRDAEVFVMSSDYEGIPNALLEAMALGLPCISTDCLGGGAKLLINNRENGILVPRNDDEALSIAIEELIGDNKLRKKIGLNASKVREQYSKDIIFGQWNNLFMEIVE